MPRRRLYFLCCAGHAALHARPTGARATLPRSRRVSWAARRRSNNPQCNTDGDSWGSPICCYMVLFAAQCFHMLLCANICCHMFVFAAKCYISCNMVYVLLYAAIYVVYAAIWWYSMGHLQYYQYLVNISQYLSAFPNICQCLLRVRQYLNICQDLVTGWQYLRISCNIWLVFDNVWQYLAICIQYLANIC